MTRPRLFEISLVIFTLALYTYAALSDRYNFGAQWFIRDDAYYYFKVAQNISEGRGSTFDGINPTNGYHPLWMLVCLPIFALARFDLVLPLRVLLLVSGLISAWTGVLIFRLVRQTLSTPAAVLAACYWVFDRAIHERVTQFGLETGLTALTLGAFLLTLSHLPPERPLPTRRIWTLGLLAVAVTFSRLDTIFLTLLAGAWIVLRGTPIRTRLMLDVVVLVSAAFLSLALRLGLPAYFTYARTGVVLALLGTVVHVLLFFLFGQYQPLQAPLGRSLLQLAGVSLLGSAITSGGMIGLGLGNHLPGLPRSALPLYAGLVLLGAGIVRVTTARRGRSPSLNWQIVIREAAWYYGILGGALAIYMGFNQVLFGTPMPVSGQIKHWWGSLQGSAYGNPIQFLSGFLGLEAEEGINAWGPITVALARLSELLGGNLWLTIGLMAVISISILATRTSRARRAAVSMGLPLLLAGAITQMFYYRGQGYAGDKDWYWVTQMLLVTLCGALLYDLATRPLRRAIGKTRQGQKRPLSGPTLVWAVTAAVALYYSLAFASMVIQRMPWQAQRPVRAYMDVLPFLEANTEEGALIGMTGGGNVGYFIQDRTIVNMDGLINSYPYFLALRAGRADAHLQAIGMKYIFANPDLLQRGPYNGQFDEWSEKIGEFGKKDLLRYRP